MLDSWHDFEVNENEVAAANKSRPQSCVMAGGPFRWEWMLTLHWNLQARGAMGNLKPAGLSEYGVVG